MNRTLMLAGLREKLSQPILLTLVGFLFLMPLIADAFSAHPTVTPHPFAAVLFAVILGAGMMGRDVSSGVLGLLFTRPMTRAEYVISRWATAVGAAGALVVLQLALETLISLAKHGSPVPTDVILDVANGVLTVVGVSSVLGLLSSLVSGYGDLGLLVAAEIVSKIVSGLGQTLSSPTLQKVGEITGGLVVPQLDLLTTFHSVPISWFALTSYLSTVTLCLTLAIFFVNRKEVSYAS